MKRSMINLKKHIRTFLSLPYFWVAGITLLLSVITLLLSALCKDSNVFWSSLLANISAGLITGLVISFISAIKAMCLYKTESLIEWLTSLHEDILEYINKEHELISFCNGEELSDEEVLYNYIYDTLCCGENINATIIQGGFDESLAFDPCKYFAKEFGYDAGNHSKENLALRETIMGLDVRNVTREELRALFENLNKQLSNLNSAVLKQIKKLETRKKAINVSVV